MLAKIKFLLLFCVVGIQLSAQSDKKLFTKIPADSSSIYFNNIVEDNQVLNVISYEYYYNGGGIAIGDINNDGLQDVYMTSNVYENKLYLNLGNLKFKDITQAAGVNGGSGYHTGAVIVDINNDGWLDIYVCRSVSSSVSERENILYINNKNGTFTNQAKKFGLNDAGFATQAYFNDIDKDGDLDCYILNHPYNLNNARTIRLTYNAKGQLEAAKDKPNPYETCRYYENKGDTFIDRTKESGLITRAFALSAILEDFNGDGLVDIYQCNDYLEPDYLFINDGHQHFTNQHEKYFKHGSYSSMGSDYADLNNDGLSDLITVDMLPENNARQKSLRRSNNYDEFDMVVKYGFGHQYAKNVVQLNNGNGTYSDISYLTTMAYSDWSWGTIIQDFDNDGWKDVYIANGYMRDITDMDIVKYSLDSIKKEINKAKNPNDVIAILNQIPSVKIRDLFFRNYGNLNFKKLTKEAGIDDFTWSFASTYADLDNDGDEELLVNNCNDFASLYKNNSTEFGFGKSVQIQLVGPEKNLFGIGTKLILSTSDGLTQTNVFNPFRGYLSNSDYLVHFGCGRNDSAVLTVIWPDGRYQIMNVRAQKRYMVQYNPNLPFYDEKKPIVTLSFEEIAQTIGLDIKHQENDFIDFKLEPLLPYRLSKSGPCIAVGDLNNDQREDIVIGGAKKYPTKIFIQQESGKFMEWTPKALKLDSAYEDGAILLDDIDADKDLDIIIASGGNDYQREISKYPLRIYRNTGNLNFEKVQHRNTLHISSNYLSVTDMNKDGKKEYFVGGRSVPGHYGLVPSSYLFNLVENEIDTIPAENTFRKMGMVTCGQWVDLNKDGWDDLVVAGHWMEVKVFYNNAGKLNQKPERIGTYSAGWWNQIKVEDLDQDGDLDIVAGNLGLNSRYTSNENQPMTMFVNDYDKNGSTDIVINVFNKDKSFPITIRDYLLDQMPMLRKKYLRYKQYAQTTITEMFSESLLKESSILHTNNMRSGVFYQGKDVFEFVPFPNEAQVAPINGIIIEDFNGDGEKEVMIGGNNYSTEVETGRDDAGTGLVLTGFKNQMFTSKKVHETQLRIDKDVKCIVPIQINQQKCYIIGNNEDVLQVYKQKK